MNSSFYEILIEINLILIKIIGIDNRFLDFYIVTNYTDLFQ